MTKLTSLAKTLLKELSHLSPRLTVCGTGSVYIKLTGNVKQLRLSNHAGRKTSRNSWEVRTDAMTTRKNNTRIYNVNAVSQLIADLN